METMTIPKHIKTDPIIDEKRYQTLYQQSIEDPNTFWANQLNQFLDLHTPFNQVFSGQFNHAQWFVGAKLNASYQCIDRHLPEKAQDIAIFWEGDEPRMQKSLTYQALHDEVCRMSNVLKSIGVKKGDRVCIYLPMILEAPIAMLACARIGAIHSVVFAGFSANALKTRINDAKCKAIISTEVSKRGGKTIPLKQNVDTALEDCPQVNAVLMISENGYNPQSDKEICYFDERKKVAPVCEPTLMDAEDPLFILYTSGSTGKSKGVLHTTCGYLLYTAMTHKYVFDYQQNDIYWCAADVGWITGHSYIVYGPLANGATSVMFEGVPTYPTPARFWQVIDKYKVTIFYTAPTAIRTLMGKGENWVKETSRKSLRILGSVGEPINPEVWLWYYENIGNRDCPIVDTWWQTETGGIMISALPYAMNLKPGFAAKPFFGIKPKLIDEKGNTNESQGLLAIEKPWPGMARTLFNNDERYQQYFAFDYYITGDGAKCDKEGYFQITGRTDDVLNVSGHRLGTAEIESAILEHHACAEAAVVGRDDAIKGQSIYAFVTLKEAISPSLDLINEIKQTVRSEISPIATPETIQFTQELPKTRSGKIMRRILNKIANQKIAEIGDTSTLANPDIIEKLLENSAKPQEA